MKEKYDVGIFGLWYGRNYGSIITYYALNCVLKEMGFSTVMIRNPLSTESPDIDSMPPSHPYLLARDKYSLAPFYRLEDMGELNKICRSFLLGSDQMWNYHLSKPYKQSYFLDFADDKKVKVSYGTSFGMYPYNGPDEEKETIRKNLSRMTGISVRDDFSKEIINSEFHLNAEQVVDPVFLCDTEEYRKLISEDSSPDLKDYIFAYILDPNKEFGEMLLKLAEKKKIITVFNELGALKEYREKLNAEHENITFMEHLPIGAWLKCFANADFVLTDSFHGTCFSVIFEKPFYVVKNQKRGAGRFDCLLGMLGLESQLSADNSELDAKLKDTGISFAIDYNAVKKRLEYHKKFGYNWLKNLLSKGKEKNEKSLKVSVVDSMNMNRCTGCGACVNICPKDALKLAPDKYGYYKPEITMDKCIECGICSNTCPALHLPEKNASDSPELYAFIAKDTELLEKSSSGGIFSVLAEKVLSSGGCVAGASWTDDLTVGHILIESPDDLEKLRRSKYMQSYTGTIYRAVKEKLEQKKPVLFSGCPCQAAALKAYLGKEYDALVIVDLLCSNAPSAMFFKKYIQDSRQSGVNEYTFRYKDKNCDWNCFTLKIKRADGSEEIRKRIRDDDYQRVYHSHTMCPEHCEHCIYQSLPRFGDITIGDFWGISKKDPDINAKKGVSAILCNNKKGEKLLRQVSDKDYSLMKKVPLSWLGGNGYAVSGHNYASPNRNVFYELILEKTFPEAVDMAIKPFYREMRMQGVGNQLPQAQFSTRFAHFRFDPSVWQQYYTDKALILTVPAGKSLPKKYASLYLNKVLEKGRKYTLHMKFRVKTTSNVVHFHIKASENDCLQVVHVYKPEGSSESAVTRKIEFIPDANIYDEFMIGASQISGDDNFFALEYLYIV